MLGLSEGNWKLQLLAYTDVRHSSSPPKKRQNEPVVHRSNHDPLMKLSWIACILKHNRRHTSGSRTPATAARLLSMLLSCRAQAGWNRLLKAAGAGLASSPLRQQKAVQRERILEKGPQPHHAHPRVPTVLLGHPLLAHTLAPHTLLRPCSPPAFPPGHPRVPGARQQAQVS